MDGINTLPTRRLLLTTWSTRVHGGMCVCDPSLLVLKATTSQTKPTGRHPSSDTFESLFLYLFKFHHALQLLRRHRKQQ